MTAVHPYVVSWASVEHPPHGAVRVVEPAADVPLLASAVQLISGGK